MSNLRQIQRHCKRILQCYRQVKIAEAHIQEIFRDFVGSLSDFIGIDTHAVDCNVDVRYLHAAVISRCILVQKDLESATTFKTNGQPIYEKAIFYAQRMTRVAGWKSSSLLSKCPIDYMINTTSLVVSIRNPGIFLQSPLFLSICEMVGHDVMLNILLSYRMLVPASIFEISRKVGYNCILGQDATTEDADLIRAILIGTLREMEEVINIMGEAKGACRPFIFIQCSGTVMYDDNLRFQPKENTWSNITLSRHTVLYKDSFSRKFGFVASDLLGAATKPFVKNDAARNCNKGDLVAGPFTPGDGNKSDDLSKRSFHANNYSSVQPLEISKLRPKPCENTHIEDMSTWKVVHFILFNRDFVNHRFGERRKAVRTFVEGMASAHTSVNRRKSSMLYGIYQKFKDLLRNVANYDLRRAYWSHFRHVMPGGSIDPNNVISFVHQVVDSVVPCELIGCRDNFVRLKEVCRSVVILNKGESLSMSQIMKGFKARGCTWHGSCSGRLTKGQTCTILGYLCRIVFFILEHLAIPLLQRHFYITETSYTMYRLLYFRKADWYHMVMTENSSYLSKVHFATSTNSVADALTSASEHMEAPHMTSSRVNAETKSNCLRVRWIPKLSGMRPILNCNATVVRRPGVSRYFSYNDMMKMPFHALAANIRMNPQLLGNGILGYTGAFRSIKQWWIRFRRILRLSNHKRDYLRLHVILADLSRCYENIPHKYLLEALARAQLHAPLLFKRIYRRDLINVASSSNSYSRRMTILSRVSSSSSSLEVGSLISRSLGQFCVYSRHADDYFSYTVSKSDIISAVKGLLSQFQISLPKLSTRVHIRRTVGIPQGCCISPLLCSLFLAQGDMDTGVESLTTPSRGNLFLRWIDDFIFISTSEDDARDMMRILENNSAFGVAINDKCSVMHVDIPLSRNCLDIQCQLSTTETSRPSHDTHTGSKLMNITTNDTGFIDGVSEGYTSETTLSPTESSDLLWINSTFEFDLLKGHLNATLKPWKNHHSNIRDSLSLSRMGSSTFMFAFLEQRLLGYLSNRLQHGLFTSVKLNALRCILQNSYIAMRICIMKLQCAASALVRHFGGFINPRYFGRLAHKLVGHAHMLVSRGGFNVRQTSIRRVLQLAVIYTFSPRLLHVLRRKFGRRRIRFICAIERKFKGQWPLYDDERLS
ncbi:hypothetical protein X943_002549 [Babesia divergens]|uniref:Telomerase reverse transcriptase n=1 Tax=Babesia divergens TaxID=32595 RepID=A0AAD9GD45_BABDI|nr:hypothetical protein X943_002549 [Babesia divergens]